jgi:hypothetical protein
MMVKESPDGVEIKLRDVLSSPVNGSTPELVFARSRSTDKAMEGNAAEMRLC